MTENSNGNTASEDIDLLFGAEAVARALGLSKRQVYHAVEFEHLPLFKIGATICARRSTLSRWFDAQESGACVDVAIGCPASKPEVSPD